MLSCSESDSRMASDHIVAPLSALGSFNVARGAMKVVGREVLARFPREKRASRYIAYKLSFFEMFVEILRHLKHRNGALAAENFGQQFIGTNISSILGILELFALNVLP